MRHIIFQLLVVAPIAAGVLLGGVGVAAASNPVQSRCHDNTVSIIGFLHPPSPCASN
jgi:hypothetical protein